MRRIVSALGIAMGAVITALFLLLWLTIWPAWKVIWQHRVRTV